MVNDLVNNLDSTAHKKPFCAPDMSPYENFELDW